MLASAHQGVARGLPKLNQYVINPSEDNALTYIRDLGPIECNQTHPQAINISK